MQKQTGRSIKQGHPEGRAQSKGLRKMVELTDPPPETGKQRGEKKYHDRKHEQETAEALTTEHQSIGGKWDAEKSFLLWMSLVCGCLQGNVRVWTFV